MAKDHTNLWNQCLDIIKAQVDPQSYRTWFSPIKATKLEGNALTLQVPNQFFYDWIEKHFVREIALAIKQVFGAETTLEYNILVENHRKIGTRKDTFDKHEIKNPFVIPGIKQIEFESNLNPNSSFHNYVEGECNKLARAAGLAIAKSPGTTAFNPLIIYGGVGIGKTHLMNAIGNQILANNPKKKIVIVTTERFTNQVVQSIKDQTTNDLLNFYQMLDVLIIDDIQFLARKKKTQEIFFNIFNQLHKDNKQLIFSSDKSPKELADVQERLISRFKWGLVAELKTPQYETKKLILEMIIEKNDLDVPEEVNEYLCKNIKTNIRELEGVLVAIKAQSTLTDREIDIALAKEVIGQYIEHVSYEVTIDNIKELVAKYFDVSIEKIDGKSRVRNLVEARQLAMYLCKEHTSETLKTIGHKFGKKDHTSVLYSVKAVENTCLSDGLFRSKLQDLQKLIKDELQS